MASFAPQPSCPAPSLGAENCAGLRWGGRGTPWGWGGVRQDPAGARGTEEVRSSGSTHSIRPLCLLPCPVFLSFFGIASIGLSCLVALFLYHVVFGIQYLGILNGVAAFVIVGIGELPLLPW